MSYEIGIRSDYCLPMRGGQVSVERDLFLGINGQKIVAVEAWRPELELQSKKFIHAKNKAVLPGFINTHVHLPMTLFRGLEDDVPFHVWLFERILPLENELVSRDFMEAGLELAALECTRFGVTTVNEMYFYSQFAAETWERLGLRAYVSQTWSTFPLPEDKELGRDKKALFLRLHERLANSTLVRPALAPHAPYSCDDAIFRDVVALSEQTGAPIHTHVSETTKEVEDSFQKFGKSPVRRLQELGVLKKGTICAHSIHLSEEDIQILKSSGAGVSYNPDSNMKLGSGAAPIARYLSLGIPVGLGTDGTASNNDLSLFGVMDLGTKLQKLVNHSNTAMVAEQALVAATWGGAKLLGWEKDIGSLEVGKQADIVLIDLHFPHLQPLHSLVSQLVYAAQGLEVDTVFVAGKILLEGKRYVSFDSERVYQRAGQWRDTIQARLKDLQQ